MSRTERARATLRTHWVLSIGLSLILLQTGYRVWATLNAYYHYDDFNFISRMINEGPGIDVAARQYSGHIMPGGMYLTWLLQTLAPYGFWLVASVLCGMQLLAALLLLRLLVRMFGVRPGILPPLALYLFNPITMPVAIWWAAGVNQLPMHIAFFGALASHVQYLRSRRIRHALLACTWILGGLLFFEKTLLVFGALAFLTLAYFATGGLGSRLLHILQRYGAGIAVYVTSGAAYLALYVRFGLTFEPERATNDYLLDVISNMSLEAYAPTLLGGPLRWWELEQWALPTPGDLVVWTSVAIIAVFIRELAKTRLRALRALWLVAFFLTSNILLVLAGRASFVGALISLDFRYQGEMAAVTAVALACATLPLLGAPEAVEPKRPSEFLDHPRRVALASTVVAALGLISSTQYALHWNSSAPARDYVPALLRQLESAETPVPLVDNPVPADMVWELAYPDNTISHLFRQFDEKTGFPSTATDHLGMVDADGVVRPVAVPPVRVAVDGDVPGCGHRVSGKPVTIPLDGPAGFGGWWVRIGYLSSGASPVQITMGKTTRRSTVQRGLHALYLKGPEGDFDSITISGLEGRVNLCTDDVAVGRPTPLRGAKP